MALRAIKPINIEKRLKALFYGGAGVGKTTAAIQFPKPYLIDTERGAENSQYVKLLNEAGGAYYFTTDPDELITEVKSLLSEKHEYKTLIIDPLTTIYNDLLDRSADKVGTDFGRHKGPADRKIKHLMALLTRLDMNVIITSHAKPKWTRAKDKNGNDTVIEEGNTFDCYGRLDYLFDLVFEIQKRGKDRIGIVKKSRIESFPEGEQFPFNYENISQKYGKSVLEKDATVEELSTSGQIEEMKRLVELLNVPSDSIEKMLDKNNAGSYSEMSSKNIQGAIDQLKAKINGDSQKKAA